MPAKKPTITTPPPPPSTRARPIREQLHEVINENTSRIVKNGLKGIDQIAADAKANLKHRGFAGTEEIVDSAADLVKRLFVRGISK